MPAGVLIAQFFEENGKFAKGIEIEPVDNKLKTAYLPDASAALRYAIGVNPAIIGQELRTSNLGGSGSNIREAYTVLVPRRNTTLEDWALWRDFNGWDTDLEDFQMSI
jgi:hypothetical protein